MTEYKYKTVQIPLHGSGFFGSRKAPDLEDALNHYGERGWKFQQIIFPPAALGEATNLIAVFEREADEEED